MRMVRRREIRVQVPAAREIYLIGWRLIGVARESECTGVPGSTPGILLRQGITLGSGL